MSLFVFLTQTDSIAAQYFSKTIHTKKEHKFEIVLNLEDAIALKPDFILITAYDHREEYMLTRKWTEEIKKRLPAAKILIGGPAFRSRPVAYFINLKADYALRGEADFTFLPLVNEITKKSPDSKTIKKIPGVMFAENGHVFINHEYPSLSRNQLEALDFSHYCHYGKDMVSIFTERGCPFGCTYCSRVFGKKIRFISINRIIEILKEITKQPNITKIMFVNDNMIYSLRRANKFFGRIIEEKLNERFTFLINARIDNFITDDPAYAPHRLNLDLINLLQQAGVKKISFGTESFNDAEIVRLKPEATYRAIDAIRLTRELGKKGIVCIHFMMQPSPDALPEEALESTCGRLLVLNSYRDYIEISAVFANPIKIVLVRGSNLYSRALEHNFELIDLNDPKGTADIEKVEELEQNIYPKLGQDAYLPFLNPQNRFGTTEDPYKNLLLLETELHTLMEQSGRNEVQELRYQKLSKNIKFYRKILNKINCQIKKIDTETRLRLKNMLAEIEGIGKFFKKIVKLPKEKQRKLINSFTEKFHEASYIIGPKDAIEADTRQLFYLYLMQAVNEFFSNTKAQKQILRKHMKLTPKIVIEKMLRLRANSPLHVYLYYLNQGVPFDKPSINLLKKHLKKYSNNH